MGNIFGNSPYVLFSILGFTVSILFALFILLSRYQVNKYFNVILFSLIGLIIGARLFGIISRFLALLYEFGEFMIVESIMQSGIVYYGGLIGYILCAKILCRLKRKNFGEISDVIALIIPLFHFFGRIGCFYTGCCYGIMSNSALAIPCKVKGQELLEMRIPVQLYESCVEILLFVFIFALFIKKSRENKLLDIYLIVYSIWRFCIEFFRDDAVRGVYYGLSFSQLISIIIWVYICIKGRKLKDDYY